MRCELTRNEQISMQLILNFLKWDGCQKPLRGVALFTIQVRSVFDFSQIISIFVQPESCSPSLFTSVNRTNVILALFGTRFPATLFRVVRKPHRYSHSQCKLQVRIYGPFGKPSTESELKYFSFSSQTKPFVEAFRVFW